MSFQNISHGLLDKAGMGPETQKAVAEKFISFKQGLGQAMLHIFELLDEQETHLNIALQMTPESCEQPKTRREYGLFIVIGNVVAGYFLWWRRLPFEEQLRWRATLHLRN